MPRLARVEHAVLLPPAFETGPTTGEQWSSRTSIVREGALAGVRDVEAEVQRVAGVGLRGPALDDLDAGLQLRVRVRAGDGLTRGRRDGGRAVGDVAGAARARDRRELVALGAGVGLGDRVRLARLDGARVRAAVGQVVGDGARVDREAELRLVRRRVGRDRVLRDDDLRLARVRDRAGDRVLARRPRRSGRRCPSRPRSPRRSCTRCRRCSRRAWRRPRRRCACRSRTVAEP